MTTMGDPSTVLRIGLAQTASLPGDPAGTERHVLDAIDALAEQQVNLLVLPELCSSEYFPVRRDEQHFRLAKREGDAFTGAVAERARNHGCTVLLPVFEQAGNGVYYNSVLCIGPDGTVRDRYRKTHVPAVRSFEKYYFRPGNRISPLFGSGLPLGCLICQDRFFPEASRLLALQGASLLVIVNASADYANFRQTWEAINRTRAYETGCFVIAVNRCGLEGDVRFFGQSMVVAPSGEVIAEAGSDETNLICTIDLAETTRWRHVLQMYRDYRSELYGGLSQLEPMDRSGQHLTDIERRGQT